jgi:hypothetical protein
MKAKPITELWINGLRSPGLCDVLIRWFGESDYEWERRLAARGHGAWPDVPKRHRPRTAGALKHPVNELVEERNAANAAEESALNIGAANEWTLCCLRSTICELKLLRP